MNCTVKEGGLDFCGFKTYYRIVNPDAKKTPLIMLHGGPGSTHNSFEVLDYLAYEDDRSIIMYDQIGCGKSMISGRPELFKADTWLDELEELRSQLSLRTCHILGQSWGGMLAIYYAIERKPSGVSSFVLSSTLPSAKLWEVEQRRQISYMPQEMQAAINDALSRKDYSSDAYLAAVAEFMDRHCYGDFSDDDRACLKREKVRGDEAYLVAWGPNEFTPTGTLSSYDFTDRLCEIKEPCLVISGQRDLCTPYIAKTMYDRLPNAKWELFQYSRHVPYVEETKKYGTVLLNWLNDND